MVMNEVMRRTQPVGRTGLVGVVEPVPWIKPVGRTQADRTTRPVESAQQFVGTKAVARNQPL